MMRTNAMRWVAIAGVLCLLGAACGATRSGTRASSAPSESSASLRASLVERVNSFNRAFREGDWATVTRVIAPRFQASLAQKVGQPVEKFQAFMAAQTAKMMETVTIHSYEMTVPDDDPKPLDNGLYYLKLPTTTDLSAEGERMQQTTTTFALYEDGAWSLNRIASESQEGLFKGLYPELHGVSMR